MHVFSEAALVLHNRQLFPGGLAQGQTLPTALSSSSKAPPENGNVSMAQNREMSIPALIQMATEWASMLHPFPHFPEVLCGLAQIGIVHSLFKVELGTSSLTVS